jgi:hypothetical protein
MVDLVEGRACGTCNVCCVVLTIDEPTLRKPEGYRCKHLTAEKSCGIYDTRPEACRLFHCGWRLLKWVREPLRPDRSGVLIRLHGEDSKTRGKQLGIALTLLTHAALKAEGLAETVAAAVAANVPVYLHEPGPPGHTAAIGRINEVLAGAVAAKDKAGVLEVLRQAKAQARRDLRGRSVPISLGSIRASGAA